MKRRILATQNHAVRLHEKTVHLRGQAFSTKTGLAKQHDSLLFNKALDGYLGDRKPTEWRAKFYVKLMTPFSEKVDPRAIICAGKVPRLNRHGIKYMNALLHEFGNMISDIG